MNKSPPAGKIKKLPAVTGSEAAGRRGEPEGAGRGEGSWHGAARRGRSAGAGQRNEGAGRQGPRGGESAVRARGRGA